MNIEQAVKAALDMPHVIARFSGKDLGSRVHVELVEQTGDTAKLKVKDRADDRAASPPRPVLLTCARETVSLSGAADAQPEMALVIEHLRNQTEGAGPVRTLKSANSLFVVGFALAPAPVIPERATRRSEAKASTVEGNQ